MIEPESKKERKMSFREFHSLPRFMTPDGKPLEQHSFLQVNHGKTIIKKKHVCGTSSIAMLATTWIASESPSRIFQQQQSPLSVSLETPGTHRHPYKVVPPQL